jgi:cold shock CspA family protein/ribosome-associated translation inhibitor RaiA
VEPGSRVPESMSAWQDPVVIWANTNDGGGVGEGTRGARFIVRAKDAGWAHATHTERGYPWEDVAMRGPLQVTFHDVEASPEIRALVEEKIAKLSLLYDGILGARVIIDAPHQKHREGNRYRVSIEIKVPGTEIVATREPGDLDGHANPFTTVRDGFRAIERQLKAWMAVRRGDVRREHIQRPIATVLRLHPYQGYGFLLSDDGREIYFERGAVLHDQFDRLHEGDEVHFAEQSGAQGARASTVEMRHGPSPD